MGQGLQQPEHHSNKRGPTRRTGLDWCSELEPSATTDVTLHHWYLLDTDWHKLCREATKQNEKHKKSGVVWGEGKDTDRFRETSGILHLPAKWHRSQRRQLGAKACQTQGAGPSQSSGRGEGCLPFISTLCELRRRRCQPAKAPAMKKVPIVVSVHKLHLDWEGRGKWT